MKIVVDTNILFSFFWEGSITRKLLLASSLELISPEYALEELRKYKAEILRKTGAKDTAFEGYLRELKRVVKFIKKTEYSDYSNEAKIISPDKKDSEFLALCLKESCHLWSNDLLLKRQNKVKVLTTEEIIRLL